MSDTAQRIKQTAIRLFTEFGFEGASLSDIAKQVGIKTPSIYAHFSSKEQLFLRLVEDVIQEEQEKCVRLMADGRDSRLPAKERLRQQFDYFTDYYGMSAGRSFLRRVMLVPPRGLEQHIRDRILQYEDHLSASLIAILEEAAKEAGATANGERQVAVFYALIDGLLVEFQLYDDQMYKQRARIAWEWLWDGITRGG